MSNRPIRLSLVVAVAIVGLLLTGCSSKTIHPADIPPSTVGKYQLLTDQKAFALAYEKGEVQNRAEDAPATDGASYKAMYEQDSASYYLSNEQPFLFETPVPKIKVYFYAKPNAAGKIVGPSAKGDASGITMVTVYSFKKNVWENAAYKKTIRVYMTKGGSKLTSTIKCENLGCTGLYADGIVKVHQGSTGANPAPALTAFLKAFGATGSIGL